MDNTVKGLLSEFDKEKLKEEVTEKLRAYFKPEFLNRIDETVFFDALRLEDLKQNCRYSGSVFKKAFS